MNADAFRYLYDYHFAENRAIWDRYITALSQEQFTQPVAYSTGSIRNHIVHLMNVDEAWFGPLRGVDLPEASEVDHTDDREAIRDYGDRVEQEIRAYLATLTDDMLFTTPIPEGEDANLILWQVLLHVANHGTDHRAQLLRLLNDQGLKTGPQDFIFYAYDHS